MLPVNTPKAPLGTNHVMRREGGNERYVFKVHPSCAFFDDLAGNLLQREYLILVRLMARRYADAFALIGRITDEDSAVDLTTESELSLKWVKMTMVLASGGKVAGGKKSGQDEGKEGGAGNEGGENTAVLDSSFYYLDHVDGIACRLAWRLKRRTVFFAKYTLTNSSGIEKRYIDMAMEDYQIYLARFDQLSKSCTLSLAQERDLIKILMQNVPSESGPLGIRRQFHWAARRSASGKKGGEKEGEKEGNKERRKGPILESPQLISSLLNRHLTVR